MSRTTPVSPRYVTCNLFFDCSSFQLSTFIKQISKLTHRLPRFHTLLTHTHNSKCFRTALAGLEPIHDHRLVKMTELSKFREHQLLRATMQTIMHRMQEVGLTRDNCIMVPDSQEPPTTSPDPDGSHFRARRETSRQGKRYHSKHLSFKANK